MFEKAVSFSFLFVDKVHPPNHPRAHSSPKTHRSYLEDTLSVSERRNVPSGVLLVHGLAGELLGDHVAEDTEHGGAAVVELGVELAGLGWGTC